MKTSFTLHEYLSFITLTSAAGAVNVIGLISASNLSLSHMTGNVSESAIAFGNGNYVLGLQIISLIIAFFMGAALSGYFSAGTSINKLTLSKLLFLEAILLILSFIGFYLHFMLGAFLASMACGLQNAALANYASSWMRTTHLTGIISDLGHKIGVLAAKAEVDQSKFRLQLLLTVFFLLGGIIGAIGFNLYQFKTVLSAGSIILLIAAYYWLTRKP